MEINVILAIIYAVLWPILPRTWRWLLVSLPIITVLIYSTNVWSYPSMVIWIFSATEIIVSLYCTRSIRRYRDNSISVNKTEASSLTLRGLRDSSSSSKVIYQTFIHTTFRMKTESPSWNDLMTQFFSYGSFMTWCMLTFCYFPGADASASATAAAKLQVGALATCVCVTLFQIPVHLTSAAFYTESYGLFEITSFPLNIMAILSVTCTDISFAMHWYPLPEAQDHFIVYIILAASLPLVFMLGHYWWETKRFLEMITWMILIQTTPNASAGGPASASPASASSTEELVMASIGFAFAGIYLIELLIVDLRPRVVKELMSTPI